MNAAAILLALSSMVLGSSASINLVHVRRVSLFGYAANGVVMTRDEAVRKIQLFAFRAEAAVLAAAKSIGARGYHGTIGKRSVKIVDGRVHYVVPISADPYCERLEREEQILVGVFFNALILDGWVVRRGERSIWIEGPMVK